MDAMNGEAAIATAYHGLAYDRDELSAVMRTTYDELIDFVTTDAFKALMLEMGRLPHTHRPQFVASVLLDKRELAVRGITAPEGVLIQRSAFGDRRPTLFVVKKFLPSQYTDVWQNVNITFDNEFADESVARDVSTSWRPPLDFNVQAQAMSEDRDLQEVTF